MEVVAIGGDMQALVIIVITVLVVGGLFCITAIIAKYSDENGN